jgi:hypothetical protein
MSSLVAAPEAMVSAASNITGIGSTLSAASAAAAIPTTGVLAPAADGVSAEIAAFFSEHGLGYQQVSAQVSAFHDKFVGALTAGANAYAATEANAAQMLFGSTSNAVGAQAAAVSSAVTSVLQLQPTAGTGAVAAAGTLLRPAAAAPEAIALAEAYLGFDLNVTRAVSSVVDIMAALPFAWVLAPQVAFVYLLGEPIVSGVVLGSIAAAFGVLPPTQALYDVGAITASSIQNFAYNELNWLSRFGNYYLSYYNYPYYYGYPYYGYGYPYYYYYY